MCDHYEQMYSSKETGIWTSLASVQNAFKSALAKEVNSPIGVSTTSNSIDRDTAVVTSSNELNRSYQKVLKPPTALAPQAPIDDFIDPNVNMLDIIQETNNQLTMMFEALDAEISEMKTILSILHSFF